MTAILKMTANFTEAEIDDEIILMRLDNGELLSLTDSAAAVWRLIDGQRNQADLVSALRAEFDADIEVIGRDVAELLRQLREAGLVAEE